MTTRYTDEEWTLIIRDAEARVTVPRQRFTYPGISRREFARLFDYTLLKPEADPKQIDQLCSDARQWGFNSVTVRAFYARRAIANLRGSSIRVASVVGFHDPEESQDLFSALADAARASAAGASHISLLLSSPLLHARAYDAIYATLAVLRCLCPRPISLTLVLNPTTLREADVMAACVLARASRFDAVEASEVSFDGRATVEASEYDVRLVKGCAQAAMEEELEWRGLDERKRRLGSSWGRGGAGHWRSGSQESNTSSSVSEEDDAHGGGDDAGWYRYEGNDDWGPGQTFIHRVRNASQRASAAYRQKASGRTKLTEVKASGAIKNLGDAVRCLEAGATRLGTSHAVAIMKEAQERIDRVGDVDVWVRKGLERDMGWRNSRLTRYGAGFQFELNEQPAKRVQPTRWYTDF
ncbi:MAG: hypothetical protein M1821_005223 [Bathelium mastoideum]|nr:MAG: hypothetical protein M1821_005223 [Bathelium mastoideum]